MIGRSILVVGSFSRRFGAGRSPRGDTSHSWRTTGSTNRRRGGTVGNASVHAGPSQERGIRLVATDGRVSRARITNDGPRDSGTDGPDPAPSPCCAG
jgi:hypothetical protein